MLVAYEHSVLTEAGTFFFIAAIVFFLVVDIDSGPSWYTVAGLVAALTAGHYWRPNVLVLMPVVALLHVLGGWSGNSGGAPERRSNRRRAVWVQTAVLIAAPLALTSLWDPYLDLAAERDLTFRHGIFRQALLPPEHPIIVDQAPLYYAGIRESLHNGEFYSGLRAEYIAQLRDRIPTRPFGRSVPAFFLNLAIQYPDRYLSGLGRTLIFFSGIDGSESENRICREEVLTPGSKISEGPERSE